MKKIGIITFHRAHNYGAVLQAFALKKKIENDERMVQVIDYNDKFVYKQYKIVNIDFSNLKAMIQSILSNFYIVKKILRYNEFMKFIRNKLSLSKRYTKKDLLCNYPKYDIYVAGSDQIWNSDITGEISDIYTLNFGDKGIKRISYAASVGREKLTETEKQQYKEKIKVLDYISVREESAKYSLINLTDKKIEVVLDPTLLLTADEWNQELYGIKNEKEKYILAYVVEPDEEFVKITNEISLKTGLKVIHFDKRKRGLNRILKNAYTKGPLEFVNLIKNAEYIICTSFHATVFSIIFHKKFFVIPHRKTGSRVADLLKKLDLSNRMVYNLEEFRNIDYKMETDYSKIDIILEKERRKSIKFLFESIEGD